MTSHFFKIQEKIEKSIMFRFVTLFFLSCYGATSTLDFSELKSPCPEIFSYKSEKGQWYGSLTLSQTLKEEQQLNLKIGLSIPAVLNGVNDIFIIKKNKFLE